MEHSSRPQAIWLPDAGLIPNSHLPLLVYRSVVPDDQADIAGWFERTFVRNNWGNTWRNGMLPYHHYHSITHEVLGIYGGMGTVQVGGESGPELTVGQGDVLVIPAGVGHCARWHNADFGVAGGYLTAVTGTCFGVYPVIDQQPTGQLRRCRYRVPIRFTAHQARCGCTGSRALTKTVADKLTYFWRISLSLHPVSTGGRVPPPKTTEKWQLKFV